MQLTQLRGFLVVLEEGSVSRSAVRLHLGQSTLTRQIAALENEIGTPLFERHARGVAPTAAGQSLADSLRDPLAAVETAILACRRFGHGERTELRVGYLQSLARSILNPTLAALRAESPHLKVKLLAKCPGGQIRALRTGEIDLALIGQEGRVLTREFYTRKIREVPVVAALPEDHPLAARAVLRLSDLRQERFVGEIVADAPGHNDWIVQLCRRAGFRPRFVHQAESISQALSMVVSEGGVTVLPEFAADRSSPSMAIRPLTDSFAQWDLLVAWQRGRVAPAVKSFLQALTITSSRLPELRRSA